MHLTCPHCGNKWTPKIIAWPPTFCPTCGEFLSWAEEWDKDPEDF